MKILNLLQQAKEYILKTNTPRTLIEVLQIILHTNTRKVHMQKTIIQNIPEIEDHSLEELLEIYKFNDKIYEKYD